MSKNFEFIMTNKNIKDLPEPYSYQKSMNESSEARNRRKDISEVKLGKAKELATGQLKNVFMTIFSLMFVGSNLSLFTIFIIGITAYNSLSSMLNVNSMFKPFENPQYSIIQYKFIYASFQFISFSFVLYRFYGMGLIPLNPADWVSFLENTTPELDIII